MSATLKAGSSSLRWTNMTNIIDYEETLVAFVDFLGFSEASLDLDEQKRVEVLDLLRALVALRSEFSVTAQEGPGSKAHFIRPQSALFPITL